MYEYLQTAFSGPPLLASCLLVLITFYWLLVIAGTVDLDGLDFDLDLDLDVDTGGFGSFLSFGAMPLRWLNIDRVPLMLWMSVFALAFWLVSMLWDTPNGRANGWNMTAVVIRNGAIGLLCAKAVTQPFLRVFESGKSNVVTTMDLIGMDCTPTTRVTNKKGQAKVKIDSGSPLLLSVRSEDQELERGECAQIVDYDREREVYIVRPARNEV